MVASATSADFSPALERAWIELMRVPGSVLNRVQSELKAQGFPPLEWYDVLLEVGRADGGRLRQGELGRRLLVARYNLSRLLDRLEAERLLTREPCPEDARGTVVALTPEGRALRERMWPAYAAAIARSFGERLDEGEAATLTVLLSKLR